MQRIGRYEILKQADARGLSVFYEAFDPVMKRPVAIKFPHAGQADTAEHARQEILEDAHQLAQLIHPGIVKLLNCEEQAESPFLVMERPPGQSLGTLLAERRKLSGTDVVVIVQSAGETLDFAHSKGRLHPSLTTNSLLVDDDLKVKIAGFESARSPQPAQTEALYADFPALQAALPYMSPELLKGDRREAASDQFSLGVIAFEALTGAAPFRSHSPIKLVCRIGFEEPSLHGPLAGFPPELPAVLGKALAKTPEARYSSCSDFAVALSQALRGGAAERQAPLPTRLISIPQQSGRGEIAPSETRLLSTGLLWTKLPATEPRATEPPATPSLVVRFRWALIAILTALLAAAAWIALLHPNRGR